MHNRGFSARNETWYFAGKLLESKGVGRLAQRLEHSAYTRKVVRSNRTLPTTSDIHPSGDVVQLVRTLPCHGRGREFESRRPRHSFQALAESLAF
jgi:hypothetical protein